MASELTLKQIKDAVPERCFEVNPARSIAYLLFDLICIGICYALLANTSAWYFEWLLIFLIGTLCWSLFVLGHDAGHGVFAKTRLGNTIAGVVTHGPLLVPYRGWQRSHALHHGGTGHFEREEVFRACRQEDDRLFRKILFRSGIFILLGWPMYKLGFRNIGTYSPISGSHYLTTSKLYTPSIRGSWLASIAANAVFLAIYISLSYAYGWGFVVKYILAPYLIYGAWLTFMTWMQHVSEEVPVYTGEDWTFLNGALSSVDRNYGPFNWITHNTGNYHVIHHLFPTIPHYHLKEATEAIRPILGDRYLKSDRFVLFDMVRSLIACHYVVPGEGREVYKSEFPFAANYGAGEKPQPMAAE
ncbi:MAG: fatty acid desaturase [Pseudomonadota bacterium]